MNLYFHSCKDKDLQNELETAAFFFGLQLFSMKLLKNISVDIYIRKTMRDFGNCIITGVNTNNKPRCFEIKIKKFQKKDKMISTLAHEFVHLKQFAKEELNETLDKWKGCSIDEEKTPYHDLPWEVEAFCLEEVLMSQYRQYKYFYDNTKQQNFSN